MNSAEFIKYITTPLTYEEMHILYRANNVKYDKCELYYDFIKSLNKLVVNTYLGDDMIDDDEKKRNHYDWCVEKVFKGFREERIIFNDTQNLKEYFYNYYLELFYNVNDKTDTLNTLDRLPYYSFSYERIKTRSDMDVLIELYKLFEKSLSYKLKT
jgi:hypothetical protein